VGNVSTTLSTGFALATQPVASSAISTDTEGLQAAEINVPGPDGFAVPAYLAKPKDADRPAALLVVHEVFGVHEYIKDVCRRLAKQGYLAIAPELYARQGDVSEIEDIQQIIERVLRKVSDAQVMGDLDATVRYLEASAAADTGRLGMTGFCWGGRITWLYSAHQAKLRAGVAWYGRLEAGPYASALTPEQPVDVAGRLQAPVLGLYGGQDHGIPVESVERMRAALAAAGRADDCPIVVYPDAGHAFHADYRPSYHEASAKDAWQRMLEWFRNHGVK
jgi:carboxymethylenebutenolidase